MDKLQLVYEMVIAKQTELFQTSQTAQAEFMTYVCQLILTDPKQVNDLLIEHAETSIQRIETNKASLEADKLAHEQELTDKSADLRIIKETLEEAAPALEKKK